VCANTEKPLYRLFQRRAPKSPVMITVLLLGLFGVSRAGDGSAPYQNNYYVACASTHRNCVENKCVMFGPRTTLCTECKSGSVPINGTCIETNNNMQQDTSVCVSQSTDGNTRCSSCTDGKEVGNAGGSTYFLFYGGCYNKNDWPGTHICKAVSGGTCSECAVQYYYVFTNGVDTQKKCILCGDTTDYNGKAGIAGCATCVLLDSASPPTNTASTATVQCTSCVADDMAPIDGQCTTVGSNKCENGYCTHCATGYVYHKGGCYSKTSKGNEICAEANQFEIDDYSACKQCVNSSEIPHNGNCRPASELGSCTKDNNSGKCTSCNKQSSNSNIFLYEGGCYTTDDLLGRTICTAASSGVCTTCNETQGYFATASTCRRCNDTANSGIDNCATCTPGSDGSKPLCTGCDNGKYAALDGGSCVDSCPSPATPNCNGNICACKCGTGTYPSDASCVQCDSACSECTGSGPSNCVACASGKYIKDNGSGGRTCVDSSGCGDGYYPNNNGYICTSCNIDSCKTCNPVGGSLKCTECSSGYLSLDGSSCSSQCTEPNQRKGDNNKCVCVDGFQPNGSGTCVATNTCPQQNSGCSSCNVAGECLSCSDSTQSIQPGRRSCATACPEGSQLIGALCTCMDGYALQGDACVSRSRRASSNSTVAVVSVVVALLVVAAAALACWFVLRRRRRGPRGASGRKRGAAENLELMGTVDEF
ncbi:Variant-specific surface protein, partial [Giardia duodenalis]